MSDSAGPYGPWPDEIPEHIQLRNGDSRRGKSVAVEVRNYVFHRDDYRCTHCGTEAIRYTKKTKRVERVILTIDHIVPRRDGGISHPANLRVLCWPCHNQRNRGNWE